MIAIICMLVPPLFLLVARTAVLKKHNDIYKSILLYLLYAVVINCLMVLVLAIGFDNQGQLISKLNTYYNFAFKYIALATVFAIAEPWMEKILKAPTVKAYSKVRSFFQKSSTGRNLCFRVLLTIMLFFALMMIGSMKSGYHVDEMYTFGLSNHQYKNGIGPDIVDGETYTGSQLWTEYTMVSEAHRFDYANVWENQRHDVHPPLYYAIVHTVFSFFPGVFDFHFTLAINVIFALIVFWQMVWLFNYFINSRKLSVLFSLMFMFTMGFVNSIVFFRMYVLLEVWTNALIILFCRNQPGENKWTYYLSFIIIMVGGTMTQYYFTIFAFFACAIYAIRVALQKNLEKIVLSLGSVAISFGLCTLIFPSMWKQIFSGYRGKEAFANLIENGGFWGYIWDFLNSINLRVFGNMFLLLLLMIAVLYIVTSRGKDVDESKSKLNAIAPYLQIIIPVIGYIIVLARIAPSRSDRYIMNIMGLMYLAVFSMLILLARHFSGQAVAGVFTVAFVVLFCSYKNGVPYLYTSEPDKVETIAELGNDIPCIYIYNSTWRILYNYMEMADLENIIFFKDNNLAALNDDKYHQYDDLLLFVIADDTNKIVDQILDANPELNVSQKLFSYGDGSTAYHLY